MELAINSNNLVAVKHQLNRGGDATRLIEIQYKTTGSDGELSALRWGGVAYVSLLHVAVANCFKRGSTFAHCRSIMHEQDASVDIVRLLLDHGLDAKAGASFAYYYFGQWSSLEWITPVEFALQLKQEHGVNTSYMRGRLVLDKVVNMMYGQKASAVVPKTAVPTDPRILGIPPEAREIFRFSRELL